MMMAAACLSHNHARLLSSKQIDSSDGNVLWPNVVETDGAQTSGLNETVDGEVENMLRSVSDLIKTSEGSNASGLLLLSSAAWTEEG